MGHVVMAESPGITAGSQPVTNTTSMSLCSKYLHAHFMAENAQATFSKITQKVVGGKW